MMGANPGPRTKKISRPPLEELSLCKYPLVLEDILQVLGVADDDAWWERWHGDLKRLVAETAFALCEPGEQCLPLLQESDTVAYQRPCIGGYSDMDVRDTSVIRVLYSTYLKGTPSRLNDCLPNKPYASKATAAMKSSNGPFINPMIAARPEQRP